MALKNSIKNENKKGNILYIDILRIIACFMVIINHTHGIILENNTLINSTFYCICFSLCKIGVPLFLMITGTLLLDKDYNYKKILKCIFRVLVPVLGLSLIFYVKDVGISNINIISFLKSIISAPYIIPYWYIYALISTYLTIPFLQKMIKNFKEKDYCIFILLFLIIPTVVVILKTYLGVNINYNFSSAFFPIIISLVVCGNFLSKIKLSKKYFIISILIFVVSYIGMFLSMYLPYLNSGKISYILDSWNTLPVILMSISTFYSIRYLFENKVFSKKINTIITAFSSTTFGIYLIHTALNYKLYNISIIKYIFNFNSILGIIILEILVFIVCMLIIYILKKIPIIKKFL